MQKHNLSNIDPNDINQGRRHVSEQQIPPMH